MNLQALVEQHRSVSFPVTTDLLALYRSCVSRSRDEREYVDSLSGVALSESVIDMRSLFALGETFDTEGRPRIAVAPMLSSQVFYSENWQGPTLLGAGFALDNTEALLNRWFLPLDGRPGDRITKKEAEYSRSGLIQSVWHTSMFVPPLRLVTDVPLIPRSVAPFWRRTRARCFVLFDVAEGWEPMAMPTDPYLIERLNGHQFKILAHWNLTDRERELMRLLKRRA